MADQSNSGPQVDDDPQMDQVGVFVTLPDGRLVVYFD